MGEVRNICLAGHSGAGKTTLAECILKKCGLETELDTSKEEKNRGLTIDLGMGTYQTKDTSLNILDTPGFAEFVEELYKGLWACEACVLVINARTGVEVQTLKSWEVINDLSKPSFAFINKMDTEKIDFWEIVEKMSQELGESLVPLQIPISSNGSLVGLMDLIENKPVYFGKKSDQIPDDIKERATKMREDLLESLADLDDELLRKFLEEEQIEPAVIKRALKKGLIEKSFTPILIGSASGDLGIDQLLDSLVEFGPSFLDLNDSSQDHSSLIFNLTSDPYLGQLAQVKVMGGKLSQGDSVFNASNAEKEKIRDIFKVNGGKQERIESASKGDIVALSKLSTVSLGDTLSFKEGGKQIEFIQFPKPVFGRALEPETQSDEEKMSSSLQALAQTKATIDISRDDVTKETILTGMGDTHLNVFTERLKNNYGVSLTIKRPKVPYKETIQKKANAQYRHKKQSGGRGQYGEVYLRVEPLSAGKGYEFADEIKGGVIPNQFMPGVEKGIQEAMQEGVLAGYPVTDILVACYDGSHHSVDSSEIAFKIAASRAFTQACEKASPVLLEPVYKLIVATPREFTGDIVSNLNGKRGRILGMEPEDGLEKIQAEAPLAEILDYALELKSITQGRATFQREFTGYQKVTSKKQAEELLKKEGQELK